MMAPVAPERPKKLMPFGQRVHNFAFRAPEQDAKMNVLSGSVRSAKTWSTLVKAVLLCSYEVAGRRVLTGVSKQTVYQNVLMDLFEIVGSKNYKYNRSTGELKLFGTDWLVIGAHDEGSERIIRGMTVGIVICDELVKMPHTFFMMLVSRMSPAGARLYATTNPDHPLHWVNVEILENTKYSRGLNGADLWAETFTMDDNPSLEESYKEFLKRSFTGVWFKRFVLGLWVAASGSIYGDALSEDNLYDEAPLGLRTRGGHVEHWVAVDYGTVNPCVFIDIYDTGNIVYFEREYYFDSRREGRQKTDSQYADDMLDFIGRDKDPREWPGVIIDPSAASFRAELTARGLHVIDADNSVDDGLRRVSTMLQRKLIRINRACREGLREMQSYAWNPRPGESGRDEPLKKNDHFCFAAGARIQTPSGEVCIESLSVGDSVVTPLGICKVIGTGKRMATTVGWNGTRVTPDHPVFVFGHGWLRVDTLRYTMSICEWKSLYSTASSFVGILTRSVEQIVSIFRPILGTDVKDLNHCIVKFGRSIAGQFQRAMTSITRMATLATIPFPTLRWCYNPSTGPNILEKEPPNIMRNFASGWLNFDIWQVSGIDPKLGEHGIDSMPLSKRHGESQKNTIAKFAARGLKALKLAWLNSAVTIARRLPGVNRMWMMSPEFARFAAGSLVPINIAKPAPVIQPAEACYENVYKLSTEHGCYFANGVLVSNCDALRYAINTRIGEWRLTMAA